MSEWISVKDGLPIQDEHKKVLVVWNWKTVDTYNSYYVFEYLDEKEEYYITHWMPLPEPPKEG